MVEYTYGNLATFAEIANLYFPGQHAPFHVIKVNGSQDGPSSQVGIPFRSLPCVFRYKLTHIRRPSNYSVHNENSQHMNSVLTMGELKLMSKDSHA